MNLQKQLKQMRKAAAVLTSAALIVSCLITVPLRAAAFSGSGTGSSDSPYIITNSTDLANLANVTTDNTYFELGNNIPLTGSWTPISDFSGNFDGKGYTISGLTIGSNSNYDSNSYAGLFGQVESNATIKNLNVSVSIYSSGSSVGALVGYSSGTIKNCASSGTMVASGSYVGGLVGCVNSGSIIGCSSSCTVTDTIGDAFVGGLIGESTSGVAVNSYATGSVTAGSSGCAGGFAGQNYSALNCYSAGSVTASGAMPDNSMLYAGGFAGIDSGGHVFNCYSSSSVSVSALTSSSACTIYLGGFDGSEISMMSNCFSSAGTVGAPLNCTNITVNAGGFTGELSGSYTNCYYNSSLSSANGGTNSGTGSATALSAAVFGATSTTSISYTTDGSATATATTLVDALNGGRAVFSSYSSSFSGYIQTNWKNGTAGHPVYTSLWQNDVTLTSVTLGFVSPYGGNGASTAIYQAASATATSGTDITSDTDTVISGSTVTISGLTSGTTYYYYVVFTNSGGDTYTSEAVTVKTASVNHAPTLSVTTDTGLLFSPNDINPQCLFTNATVGVGGGDDSNSQHISSITLTVTGIRDTTLEKLYIYETGVNLYNSPTNPYTSYSQNNNFSICVTNEDNDSATVTISNSSASLSVWQKMLEDIGYANKAKTPTFGERTVTITGITDDGGTLYGTDSATCSYKSDITVEYRITYVMGITGATNTNPAGYDSTTNITLVSPTATGYTFAGWYTNIGLTSSASSPAILKYATGDYTFFAKWNQTAAATYTVTFNSENGSAVASAAGLSSGAKVTKPTTPTCDGYTFGGWYKDEACTTAWDFSTDTVTADTTLYAKWMAVPVTTYTVTFNSENGSAVASAAGLSSGAKVTKPTTPTRSDYTFGGWYKDEACTTAWDFTNDTVTADTTVYAKWTAIPVTHTVTFKDYDGTVLKTVTVNDGTGATAPTNPTRTGYTFTGWDVSFSNVTRDLTVTAQYSENSNSGGSSGGSSGGGGSTTPTDITIPGTTTTAGESTATITPSQTNTSTVNNDIVKIGNVTVTAPAAVLNSALGSGTGLTLSQSAAPESTQTTAQTAASKVNGTVIAVININLNRTTSAGTEAVHNLSGAVTVTMTLTDAQIAAIKSGSDPRIYYYDSDTGTLTDINASFDLTKGTATFTTTHFSSYVLATESKTLPTVSGVDNNGIYSTDKTITFDKGTATLDGNSFTSGGAVSAQGKHTLIVTDTAGNTTTVVFAIDKTAPAVSGVNNNGIYSTNKAVTFNEGTATLDGAAFTSGTTVSKEGKHTLVVTDVAGNKTTASFVIDKSVPVVTAKTSQKAVIKNGCYSATNVTVSVSDLFGVTKTVTLNGKSCAWPRNSSFTKDGTYVVTVKDQYGHSSKTTFTIDKTVPIIAVKSVTGSRIVTVTEANFLAETVTLNGKKIAWPKSGKFTKKGTYVVTVTDKAGHKVMRGFKI